jgi:hypothetical protein
MKTVSQRIDPLTHNLVADRVEASLEPGRLMAIIEDQTHKILARTLNQVLESELSEALGREPFERGSVGRYRNGSKPLSLPGFFGRLSLRKPVLCGAAAQELNAAFGTSYVRPWKSPKPISRPA